MVNVKNIHNNSGANINFNENINISPEMIEMIKRFEIEAASGNANEAELKDKAKVISRGLLTGVASSIGAKFLLDVLGLE